MIAFAVSHSPRNWSYADALEFLAGKEKRRVPNRTNTEIWKNNKGEIHLEYYHSNVATWYPDGTIQVDHCGFATRMTVNRIEEFTRACVSLLRREVYKRVRRHEWWNSPVEEIIGKPANVLEIHLPRAQYETLRIAIRNREYSPPSPWGGGYYYQSFFPWIPFAPGKSSIRLHSDGSVNREAYFLDLAPMIDGMTGYQPWDRCVPSDLFSLSDEKHSHPVAPLLVRRAWKSNRPDIRIYKTPAGFVAWYPETVQVQHPYYNYTIPKTTEKQLRGKNLLEIMDRIDKKHSPLLTVGSLFDQEPTNCKRQISGKEPRVPFDESLFLIEQDPVLHFTGPHAEEKKWQKDARKTARRHKNVAIHRIHWMIPQHDQRDIFESNQYPNPPFPGFTAWPGPEANIVCWFELENGQALGVQSYARTNRLILRDFQQAPHDNEAWIATLLAGTALLL